MQIDPAILRAIDRCLSLGVAFFAVCDPDGDIRFGASATEPGKVASTSAFFIGRFNAPWSDNNLIPCDLTAEQAASLGDEAASGRNQQPTPLPRPTDKDQYMHALSDVVRRLKGRQSAKTVISMVRKCQLPSEPVSSLFARLAEHSTGTFAYLCFSPAIGCWMGAPPELLLKTDSDGRFETMALAGTLPVGAEAWDRKNSDEHQIVVDYIADRLSECGIKPQIGPRQSLAYGSIKHLYTPITGSVGNQSAAAVYDALNPTPALCGYPKDTALHDIADAERHQRDCYGGCIGFVEPDGTMQAYVNIRCCRIADATAYCYGGGGITPDSVPEAEWTEANSKIDNFLMRFLPT